MATDELCKWKFYNEENLYKIYEDGTVFYIKLNRFSKPFYDKKNNRMMISMTIDGSSKKNVLRTIIYKTFKNDYTHNFYIEHKDCDITNNHIDNLYLVRKNAIPAKNIIEETDDLRYIPGYGHRYIVNRNGDIKSLFDNKILHDKSNIDRPGYYLRINLKNDRGHERSHAIHRIVYQAFNGEIDEKLVITHVDGNTSNNKIENLIMSSRSDTHIKYHENKINVDIDEDIVHEEIKCENFKNIGFKYKNLDLSNYKINSYGQIIGSSDIILKQNTNKGYKNISMRLVNQQQVQISIHRLVATMFLENPENYDIVNHKDENPENNHVSNLEWCDNKYNISYSTAKKVGQYSSNGDTLLKVFDSIADAEAYLNKKNCHIIDVCKGRRKTAQGFLWKYMN